jgi:hypothetical protein
VVQKATLILVLCAVAGCAAHLPKPVERHDLTGMRPDCANARIQVQWLERQIEQNQLNAERSEYERRYIAQAKELIWTMRSTCMQKLWAP